MVNAILEQHLGNLRSSFGYDDRISIPAARARPTKGSFAAHLGLFELSEGYFPNSTDGQLLTSCVLGKKLALVRWPIVRSVLETLLRGEKPKRAVLALERR